MSLQSKLKDYIFSQKLIFKKLNNYLIVYFLLILLYNFVSFIDFINKIN